MAAAGRGVDRDEASASAGAATWARVGRWAWSFVGVVVALLFVYAGWSLLSGLVVPLVIAVVVGAMFASVTDVLAAWMPRSVAASIVLLGITVVAVVILWLAVRGIVDQAPEIGRQLEEGFDATRAWLEDLGVGHLDPGAAADRSEGLGAALVPGLTAQLGSVFSSTAAFLMGSFVGLFLLYFVLADWHELAGWVAGHLGVRPELGAKIVEDTMWALRQYFLALTVSSVLVAALVGGTAALLGIPLALTIAVITFVTAYVPFLGAIVSGAFAVLIALGSGGLRDAVILLVVILVAQNVVQTVVQTMLTQGRLHLHPIVILGSTIAGGAVLGLLGAALSTPVVAIVLKVNGRLRDAREPGGSPPGTEPVGAP